MSARKKGKSNMMEVYKKGKNIIYFKSRTKGGRIFSYTGRLRGKGVFDVLVINDKRYQRAKKTGIKVKLQ